MCRLKETSAVKAEIGSKGHNPKSFPERKSVSPEKVHKSPKRKVRETTTLTFFKDVSFMGLKHDPIDMESGQVHCPHFQFLGHPDIGQLSRIHAEQFGGRRIRRHHIR